MLFGAANWNCTRLIPKPGSRKPCYTPHTYRREEGARRARKKGGKQHVRLLTWASMLLFYITSFVLFVLSEKSINFFSRDLLVIASNLEGNLLPAHSSKIFEPGN